MAQGVYKTHTNPFTLRLSDEQLGRIEKVAKDKSKSVSDFLRDAAMAAVEAAEADMRERKKAREDRVADSFLPRNVRSSRGLGLVSRAESPPPPPPPAASPPPTVIIQQQTVSAPVRDEFDYLVDYVLAARNTIDRQERERVVKNVIMATSTDQKERERIAKTLDEKVKARTPKPEPRSGWSFLGGSK